jgi:hypothetical protein
VLFNMSVDPAHIELVDENPGDVGGPGYPLGRLAHSTDGVTVKHVSSLDIWFRVFYDPAKVAAMPESLWISALGLGSACVIAARRKNETN